jgi:hypothetical protein
MIVNNNLFGHYFNFCSAKHHGEIVMVVITLGEQSGFHKMIDPSLGFIIIFISEMVSLWNSLSCQGHCGLG